MPEKLPTVSATPLLRISNSNVKHHNKTILRNISLEVFSGDFITIVGPNGAGKSTLLKLILGLRKPDSGTVHRSNIRVGYVPQNFNQQNPIPITVQDFLQLNRKQIPDRNLIEELGVAQLMPNLLTSISAGELQRVLLIRALNNNPQLLVLDEPTQSMDISGQLKFYNLLHRIHRHKKLSIVMVSHDLHMVSIASTKVIGLFHTICCSGTPKAIVRKKEFIELFGEDYSKMMALYGHHHHNSHN